MEGITTRQSRMLAHIHDSNLILTRFDEMIEVLHNFSVEMETLRSKMREMHSQYEQDQRDL
jgi:hypothetical protein